MVIEAINRVEAGAVRRQRGLAYTTLRREQSTKLLRITMSAIQRACRCMGGLELHGAE